MDDVLALSSSPATESCTAGLTKTGLPADPFIVRMAGLPGMTLAPFRSTRLVSDIATREQIRRRLSATRESAIETLAQVLPNVEPSARREILSIKRDCFNQRPLEKYQKSARWKFLCATCPELRLVLELEKELEQLTSASIRVYEEEFARERRHLLDLLRDPALLRAIALTNPEVARRAALASEAPSQDRGRRERKLDLTALRFVSRAAAKLSPYSTLTTIGLGLITEKDEVEITITGRKTLSLVRANRSLLDQCQELLLTFQAVKALCSVSFNDTVREVAKDRYTLLREARWHFDPDSRTLKFLTAAQVTFDYSSSRINQLASSLRGQSTSYTDLLSTFCPDGQNQAEFESLFSLGLLTLLPPWPSNDVHAEKSIYRSLSQSDSPDLQRIASTLQEVLALEAGYPDSTQPDSAAERLKEALNCFSQQVDQLAGLQPHLQRPLNFYEDVFLEAEGTGGKGEVLRLPRRTAEELLRTADLVAGFVNLYNHRHDLWHTLAELWRQRWPDRTQVGFLEFYEAFAGTWKDYLRFEKRERYSASSSFNPLNLQVIQELTEIRDQALSAIPDLIERDHAGFNLRPSKLKKLLEGFPARYKPSLRSCIFVQATDAKCDLWVLHRLFEGTGRYLSRYGPAMPEVMRRGFTEHLRSRACLSDPNQDIEFLDLMYPLGNLVNVRASQTPRVLQLPGKNIDVPPEQKVLLSELQLRADLVNDGFELLDASCRRLLPVNLSTMNSIFLPLMLRFLSVFGPYEYRQILPRPALQPSEGMSSPRLTCGSLILQRQKWVLSTKDLCEDIDKISDAQMFERIHHWRTRFNLPETIFLYERMHKEESPVQSYKPQYINLTSPSFTRLLVSILKKSSERLVFEEALPSFTAFPPDAEGEPRAFELQIDGSTLSWPAEIEPIAKVN